MHHYQGSPRSGQWGLWGKSGFLAPACLGPHLIIHFLEWRTFSSLKRGWVLGMTSLQGSVDVALPFSHSKDFLGWVQIIFQYHNSKIHIVEICINTRVKLGSRFCLTLELPIKSPRMLPVVGTIHQMFVLHLLATLYALKLCADCVWWFKNIHMFFDTLPFRRWGLGLPIRYALELMTHLE